MACSKGPPPPAPVPTVRVTRVESRRLERTQEWLATLDGSTNAEIRPQVSGYIRSVDYTEGSVVANGTRLFTLDKRPFVAAVEKARGDYENAIAQLDKNRADVARYTPLAADHAISQEQLDDARTSTRAAAAQVQSMKGTLDVAKLNLDWTQVRSPIAGLAGIAQTRVGTLVSSTQVLTTVSTLDPIRASINLSQQEYLRYAEILNHANDPKYTSRRYLELVLADGRIHPYAANHVIVNREIDQTTGTLLVQTLFENPGNLLRPGLFAKVLAHTRTPADTLVIPEIAVQQLQGEARVSIVDDEGRVQTRTVKLGRLANHEYVVNSGLQRGERVVVAGAQNVQPGMKVDAQQEPAKSAGSDNSTAPADGGA
jgi:membrane fusion protein (multidrug efflux system)